MRETRGQPVRAPLSDVQYPHYPERSPRHLESPAPPRSAAWATGPAGSASPAEPPEPVPSTRTWAAVPRLAREVPGSAGDQSHRPQQPVGASRVLSGVDGAM